MLKSVIYLILLFTTIVVCKPDYHFDQEVNGWLKLHVAPAKWQQAFLSCHYEGAVLASPINLQLADSLRSIMHHSGIKSMYIGANALFSPGDYVSIEGVPLADMDVEWNRDYGEEPDDCLSLADRKVYTTCDQWLPYVCYKKKDVTSEILNECGTFDNEYNLNETTGKCYKLHEERQSWNMAYKICAAEGGHLAIINDKLEADAVTALFDPERGFSQAHIGLRNRNSGSYMWLTIHGEKIENVYNTWANGLPENNGVYDCGSIISEGTLVDNTCSTEFMFICEKDPHTTRFESP